MESDSRPSVKPQDVLDKMMYDGTFDSLRSSLVTQLKGDDDLRSFILTSVEDSQTLKTADSETKSRRQLMEELRNEFSASVLEKASLAAWKLMLSESGMESEIISKVDATYCELTGLPSLGCGCHQPHELSSNEHLSNGIVSGDSNSKQAKVEKLTELDSLREENLEDVVECSALKPENLPKVEIVDTKTNDMEDVQLSSSCGPIVMEDVQPSSSSRPSVVEDVQPSLSSGPTVMEDVQPSSSSGPTVERQSSVSKDGNWKTWMGPSETMYDPKKIYPIGFMFL